MTAAQPTHEVVIEIPRGSRNKYEVDPSTGAVWLDRTLFTAMQYPADYGYLPRGHGRGCDPPRGVTFAPAPLASSG